MSEILMKARKYEKEVSKKGCFERPHFHVTPQIGWMNDPNGFSVFQGEYHLFYQYHPYSTQWGPMHWGHMKTKDFIRWEHLPCAIAPDMEYDAQGCFSGSAIEWEGEHVLVYTGVIDKVEGANHIIRQTQCVAIGNGIDYEKVDCNPVITTEMIPQGGSLEDFRDPKIYVQDDKIYMVVGNRAEDGSGQILLYHTTDLKDWEFVSVLDQSHNQIGRMWECPDYFQLDGKQVLIFSPQEIAANKEFHNGNCVAGFVGYFDETELKFVRETIQSLDDGLDFYAPQTLLAEDGRRIMIGWLQSWDNHFYPKEAEWSGIMSIPRELRIENGRIYQLPVRELSNYYTEEVSLSEVCISGTEQFEGIHGRHVDMSLEILGKDYDTFCVKVAVKGETYTSLIYDRRQGYVELDRTHSGLTRDIITTRRKKIKVREDKMKIRIILDHYSMEVFFEEGESAMSMLFFTPQDAEGIVFESDGNAVVNIHYHKIKVDA